MDPDEALRVMLLAYREGLWSEAVEHAEALLGWLRGDGFAPQVSVGHAYAGYVEFTDAWFNRTVADALARKILHAATHRMSIDQNG